MDGYAHHDHKKRDLQVSTVKGTVDSCKGEWDKPEMKARVGRPGKTSL